MTPVVKKKKTAKAGKTLIKKAKVLAEEEKKTKEEVGEQIIGKLDDLDDKQSRIEKYFEAVGRRKESIARVRVFTKKFNDAQPSEDRAIILVNERPYFEYFNHPSLWEQVDSPLRKLKSLNRFKATVKVYGGGLSSQAGAVRHGLSRALVLFDPNFAKKLKKAGYLTRDPREKERLNYGLKKARKAPQWAKR